MLPVGVLVACGSSGLRASSLCMLAGQSRGRFWFFLTHILKSRFAPGQDSCALLQVRFRLQAARETRWLAEPNRIDLNFDDSIFAIHSLAGLAGAY